VAGISVVGLVDAAPCPRAGITVTGLSTVTPSVINIWRSVAGESRTIVRGMRNFSVTDSTYVVDYEVPLGQAVTYTLDVVGPTIPATLQTTLSITSNDLWLQDPLDPSTAVPVAWIPGGFGTVTLASSALASIAYPDPGSVARVMGALYPTLLAGNRQGAASVPLDLISQTIADGNKLRTLLGAALPLLVRSIPALSPPLPALGYMHAQVLEQRASFASGSLTTWSLTGDFVSAPTVNLLVAAWTYAQVVALWANYTTAVALGRTYLYWMRSPVP